VTGNLLYDGGESFRYCERLGRVVPEPFIYLNRADARKLGIGNGALVEVKSARGAAQMRAKVGRQVKEGTVWMPRRLRQVQANKIVEAGTLHTFVTLTKLQDAPVEQHAMPADTHAVGVGQGAPIALDVTTAAVP
jgi:anaerobic selenocysteine-containing dehydrogenase